MDLRLLISPTKIFAKYLTKTVRYSLWKTVKLACKRNKRNWICSFAGMFLSIPAIVNETIDPRDREDFPLKAGFRYIQLPFKILRKYRQTHNTVKPFNNKRYKNSFSRSRDPK
jgi:hypothetical protein